jgi:hypothetical protein
MVQQQVLRASQIVQQNLPVQNVGPAYQVVGGQVAVNQPGV